MKYCRKCGRELDDTALNCPDCGFEIKRQNSMAEGAMYGAAGPTPTGTWTPVMTEERKRKIKKKRTLTAVGICACAILLACVAVLLWQFDVIRFPAQPEQETVLRKKDVDAPTEEPPAEPDPSSDEETTEETTEDVQEEATETTQTVPETAPETTTETLPEEVPEAVPEEAPEEVPEEAPAATGEKRLIVTPPYKTLYIPGESLSLNGMVVTMQNSDGTTNTITSGYQVSPKDISGGGSHQITVSYQGCTATFTVDVITRIDVSGDGVYTFSNGMTFATYDEMPQQYKDLVNKFGMAP